MINVALRRGVVSDRTDPQEIRDGAIEVLEHCVLHKNPGQGGILLGFGMYQRLFSLSFPASQASVLCFTCVCPHTHRFHFRGDCNG